MKYILTIILIAISGFMIYSCDIVSEPYIQEGGEVIPDDTNEVVRKIVLEDFTGFRCPNCAEAAEFAETIHETYKGRILVCAIHVGFFAMPTADHTYDFRTETGKELNDEFTASATGLPIGMVSRTERNGERLIPPNSWESAVQDLLDEEPKMTIDLKVDYNESSRVIDITADIKYLEESSPNDYLVLYLLEDHFIQYQLDKRKTPSDIYDYEHNNVLRDAINSTWGDQLSSEVIPEGTEITKEYSYTIPEDVDWTPENLKILAYIHDNGDSYAIWQGEEAHLYPEED